MKQKMQLDFYSITPVTIKLFNLRVFNAILDHWLVNKSGYFWFLVSS